MGKMERKVISPQQGDAVVTFAHIAVNVVTFKAETALLPHAYLMRLCD